jgi:hypothetical protein
MLAAAGIMEFCLYIKSGGRSVGIIRLRTKGHGVCFLFFLFAFI